MLSVLEIERERARFRIPKQELCAAANVHVATYARWLKQETSPQLRTVERIAKALENLKPRAVA